MHPFYR